MFAYCWRTGKIEFGAQVPDGALVLRSGPAHKLKREVSAKARHGYKEGLLLVPGLPEAANHDDAYEAYKKFRAFLNGAK